VQIVFQDGEGRRREFDVRVNSPSATVADLSVALDPDPDSDEARPLLISGQTADPELEVREGGLHEGAMVSFAAGPTESGPATPAAEITKELVVVNGLDAGRRFPLTPGDALIGRSAGCEIFLHHGTVSKRHARLTVSDDDEITLTDLESHNGTWLGEDAVQDKPVTLQDGLSVRIGALETEVRPTRDDDRPIAVDPLRHANAAGTIPFNRPPRPAPPRPMDQVRAPKPPTPNNGKGTLSAITILAPIIFAGVMWKMMHSPQVLMFAGLSPIMAIGNAVDSRRKGKKSDRSEKERFRKELDELRGSLAKVADEERERRESAYPDPAEIMRRVTLPSTVLWERRPDHQDFLQLRGGVGDVPWQPPVTDQQGTGQPPPEELTAVLKQASILTHSAVPIDLAKGGVVGIVGDRSAALALARSLVCQAAALHGPADVPVMVLANPENAFDWDWTKWLPHTRDTSGVTRALSSHVDLSTRLVEARLKARRSQDRVERALAEHEQTGPTVLVVVDDESLTAGRKAPTRNLLRGEGGLVAGIVIASTADRLPAVCTTVIQMQGEDGEADLRLPQRGEHIEGLLACGLSDDIARECARSLARFEDPELDLVGVGLPESIRLLPLLELEECTAEAVLARWKAGGIDPRPASPIGVTESDVFSVDFLADGPHGLVGGTTGAGKSELLRTMVAGLAATVDPDHLTFVLVDFKGGSAFDECAKLPHTVGMVTDLDEHLAERALRCLEAELKYRERILRDAAALDLPDYLRNRKGDEALPRLLVVIDEFATLKAELPDFIDALVGVAQRGRSLGVHMLLATQRPQGAISDNIKANTNLRIALRVQDKSDSSDVIDVTDAANIPRTAPGRAYVRLGPNEVVPIQTALSTGARSQASLVPIDLAPFVYGPSPRQPLPFAEPDGADPTDSGKEETDLAVMVAAITEAFVRTGRPEPRRPWPDPLPADYDLDRLIHDAGANAGTAGGRPDFVPVALADDPEAQRQYPVGWRPGEGNLLIYGLVGSGTTTMLSSLALAMARLWSPEELYLYAMDFGAGELGPLVDLPHCGGVVLANERERQQRLIRMLRRELDRRRQLPPPARAALATIVTMIDGWPAFVADYQDITGQELVESLIRVCSDGPEVGIHVIITADRGGGISHLIASTVRQRWAFRLADVGDYAIAGVSSRAVPTMLPGHALVSESKQLVHVARPSDGLAAAVARLRDTTSPYPASTGPPPIRSLPSEVRLAELAAPANLGTRPWVLPIGLAEHDLAPAALSAYEGEHVLVVGPARSGKSTTLLTIAAAVLAAEPDACIAAVAHGRSPLATDPRVRHHLEPGDVENLPAIVQADAPVVVVLIDDAESIDDQRLETLGASRRPNLLVVVAGRADMLRTNYNHWSHRVRRSKLGVIIKPDVDLDGDILGTRLPRRPPVAMTIGRGYIVNNADPTLAQIAIP
jgi:S-DNA-T family DNA segregation ATPase FtsK/SpoIIIE